MEVSWSWLIRNSQLQRPLSFTQAPVSYLSEPGQETITKSVSILNEGVGTAGLAVSSGEAITINAGASDSVHLRGLTIERSGTGNNSIVFNTGGNLKIENCVIRNFGTNNGILIVSSTSSSFSVSNTIVSNNFNGIFVRPIGSAVLTGTLSKVTANDNSDGIAVDDRFTTGASLNVTIGDSEASNNFVGVSVSSGSGHAATAVMLRSSVASNNRSSRLSAFDAILRVAHSVVTGNNTGVNKSSGGTIFSYGDNDIDGNTTDNTAVLTTIPTH